MKNFKIFVDLTLIKCHQNFAAVHIFDFFCLIKAMIDMKYQAKFSRSITCIIHGSRKFCEGGAENLFLFNIFHRGPYRPLLKQLDPRSSGGVQYQSQNMSYVVIMIGVLPLMILIKIG